MPTIDYSRELATFAAQLEYSDIPLPVLGRAEELMLDWVGSALAGKGSRTVETIAAFASAMGPNDGASEILISRKRTTPYFAAMVNAAASHVVEQDDVHNGSVFHPATVVFPAVLAVAQERGTSGRDLLVAAVAGYEVGVRVGEFLGRSHYRVFHTTGTAGTFAAAAAVGRLIGLTPEQMLHAFGSAGTQSAGLWEFLRDAADSKQLHTAHASAAGLMSAVLASQGFTGASHVLEGPQGLGAGTSNDAEPKKLVDGLGSRWTVAETSFKYHASCRHNHPAADALLAVIRQHHLCLGDIDGVIAHVHQAAIDVLGPVVDPQTVHQAKFSMGTVLALVAVYGRAGLVEFDAHYRDPKILNFAKRVSMVLDERVDAVYPAKWIGRVSVRLTDGRILSGRVDEPKGDPGNTLSRAELEEKVIALAHYQGGADDAEVRGIIDRIWQLAGTPVVAALLPSRG